MAAETQREVSHGELRTADAGYIECTSRRQLADEEAQVLLARLDSAAHAHDEVEVRRQLDHALLRQPQAGLEVADVVALQLVGDAFGAHPPGKLADQRERVQEDVVAEVERAGVERGHVGLRRALERLGALVGAHADCAAGAGLHQHVAAAADGVDGFLEERAILGRRAVVAAHVQVDDAGAGFAAARGLLAQLAGSEGKMRSHLPRGLGAADGGGEDGRPAHGAPTRNVVGVQARSRRARR